jgi:hypothetical protein
MLGKASASSRLFRPLPVCKLALLYAIEQCISCHLGDSACPANQWQLWVLALKVHTPIALATASYCVSPALCPKRPPATLTSFLVGLEVDGAPRTEFHPVLIEASVVALYSYAQAQVATGHLTLTPCAQLVSAAIQVPPVPRKCGQLLQQLCNFEGRYV